jgi:hypothetical protein
LRHTHHKTGLTAMTNLVWPSGLPQRPSVGGYQERFAETALRTPMEAGAAKLRQRFTAAPRQIEVSFRMTAAQVALMRVFYEETAGGGTLPFDWIHPRGGGTSSFRFVEAPRVSATSATLFSVTAKLEELP